MIYHVKLLYKREETSIRRDHDLLSDLTILIPTYNRQRLLEYSIEYWRDLSATIHIIDGSDQPCFEIGPLTGTNNIFYHHMPNSIGVDPFINFTNRLNFGALSKFVVRRTTIQ